MNGKPITLTTQQLVRWRCDRDGNSPHERQARTGEEILSILSTLHTCVRHDDSTVVLVGATLDTFSCIHSVQTLQTHRIHTPRTKESQLILSSERERERARAFHQIEKNAPCPCLIVTGVSSSLVRCVFPCLVDPFHAHVSTHHRGAPHNHRHTHRAHFVRYVYSIGLGSAV